MPIPTGEVTTSKIFEPELEDATGKKKYKVELIVKRRVVVNVEASDEDDACMVAQDIYADGDNSKYDEFLLGPDAEVEEITQ